jgi:multidrug efflux pump subunit AcrB
VRAALEGTNEIKFAAFAATLAVCAIFLPVVFMEGIVGKFFFQFGVTLSLAVLFSYVEAITLAPARCAQFLARAGAGRSGIGAWVDARFEELQRLYGRALGGSLRHPVWVLALAAAVLGGSVVVLRNLPSEFVPSQDQGRILLRLQTAVGSSLEETGRAVDRAQQAVSKLPEVQRVFAVAGGFGGNAANTGMMFVTLRDKGERKASQAEVAGRIRKELSSHAGMKAIVQDLSQQGFTAQRGFPVEFSIRGGDWNALIAESERLTTVLSASGVVTDVDTDYQVGQPELRIEPDRARAADLGVSASEIAGTVNALVGGVRVGRFNADGRRLDIRVRLLADQRSRPEQLSLLKVRASGGALVPLATLVSTEEKPSALAITRRDRERAITIFGNVAAGASQEQALAEVAALSGTLPEGVRLVLGGASMAFQESMRSLLFALLLGVIVAYMVLGAQFNSFLHPVTVLTILPLSVAGAAFALLLAGKTLNVFSMIGVLLLMGIVKKNSIVLVDYARREREAGATAEAAMSRAGPIRLRPILMTSMATGTAAIPAALALGQGAETRAPMAVAVLGGLVVSTILSLFVVPAFYVMADRASVWLRERWAPAPRQRTAAET